MIIYSFWYILSGFYHFSNFGCKIAAVTVQVKSTQNGTFLSQILLLKKIPMDIWSLTPSYAKKLGQIGP